MALPSYQILFINPSTGGVIKIIDAMTPFQLKYSRVWNGIGALALTLPYSIVTSDMLNRTDLFIEVQRTSPVTGALITEETYLARKFTRFREGGDERYAYGAVSLNHLLTRRVIDPSDDPLQAGGYSTKAGGADLVLYQYANEQIGPLASAARQMPGLTVPGVLGNATSIGLRLAYDNLYEIFRANALQADITFQVVRTTGVNMELRIGNSTTDRTRTTNSPTNPFVLLNPQRGNLTDPSLTRDRMNEATFVYIRGKGQGSSRYSLSYFDTDAAAASPFNRIEIAADARNTEKGDSQSIFTEAVNALQERKQVITFDFKPQGTEAGNVYRKNWDIGDTITVAWDNDSADVRIVGIEITPSSSGEDMSITTEVL